MVWLPLNTGLTTSTSRQVEPERTFTKENVLGSKPSSQNKKSNNNKLVEGISHLVFFSNLAKFVQMGSGLMRTTDSAYRAPVPVFYSVILLNRTNTFR